MPRAFRRAWVWLMGEAAVDDRGRRVKLVFVGGYPARLWSRVSKMPVDVHRKLRERMTEGTTGPLVWQAIIVGGTLMGLWMLMAVVIGPRVQAVFRPQFGSLPGMLLTSFLPQLLAMAGLGLWWSRHLNRQLIEGAVKLGHCPSCGYALKGLPIDADGCSTCPECGAGWRPRA